MVLFFWIYARYEKTPDSSAIARVIFDGTPIFLSEGKMAPMQIRNVLYDFQL